MFGNTNQASGGFSFGQNNNNSAGNTNTGGMSSGFKFGAGSAAPSNTNTSGGGLFGQNNNNNSSGNTGGGLFGQNNANTGNTGNTGTSGGMFGQNNNANTNTGGGGLFGNNNANTNTSANTNTGGGLFGNNNTNANTNTNTGGGLFGNNNNTNRNTNTGGGLFGNNNANTNTNTNTGGGLFGNNANQNTNTGGGLFGNNNANQNTNTGGGLFGNNNANQNTNTGGGLFGNNNANQNANTNTGGFFGNNNNATNNNAGGFGQQQQMQQQQQQAGFGQLTKQNQPSGPSVQAQLTRIKDGWDPTSPNCAFQFYFYNRIPLDDIPYYQMPQGQSPEKWDKAVAERPYKSSVPVLAVGFTDLQKRTKQQEQQVGVYRVRMHEVNNKLDELTNKHDLVTTVKIAEMRARHQRLVNRTVALAAVTQVLRNRGYVLKPEEEVLRKNLVQLNDKVTDPAVFGRINEIWARMSVLREQARHATDSQSKKAPDGTILTWERDEETLEQLAKILKDQQTGIAFLAKVLKEDMAEVENKITSLEKK